MFLRPAEKSDLDALVDLNSCEAKWLHRKRRDFFERHFDIPFFLIAEDEGRIAGFLMAMDSSADYDSSNFLWFKDRLEKFYYIDRVLVAPEQRRTGLGTALYNELLQRREGLPVVCEISVRPKNISSIMFHQSLGFSWIGQYSADSKQTCGMYRLG
jgi:uncharacterized protein